MFQKKTLQYGRGEDWHDDLSLYIYQEELDQSVGLRVDTHSEPVTVSRLEEDQG